jgi:hypothetical protein
MATNILTKAKVVHIKIEEGKTGLFYATSPDMKGLLVAERTIDELEDSIPRIITDMYAARDADVVVARIDESFSWVVIPAEEAEAAIRRAKAYA